MKKYITLALLCLSLSTVSQAGTTRIGTGSTQGNYYKMGQDIATYCGNTLSEGHLEILASGGSNDNLLGLGDKRFSMGVVQEDVLNFHTKRSPSKVNENRIKVVTPLHTEAIHILIPKGYKPKGGKGSWFSSILGNSKKTTLDLSTLKNQAVGAWGGSLISAEAISYFFNLKLKVVEMSAEAGLKSTIPMVIVAGTPSVTVQNYMATGSFVLVPLDHASISRNAGFYTKEVVNYSVKGQVKNVETIGVRAVLVGKSFRKKSRNKNASELATCITDNLADLADDPDTNPLWSGVYDFVDGEGAVGWKYFPLVEDM